MKRAMTPGIRTRGAAAVFLVLLAIFVLTNAGRIDIIDGQVRYDVAAGWLDTGRPVMRDPFMRRTAFAMPGDDAVYSAYNAGASVAAMPLMLTARLLPNHSVERDRFAFTMTGPLFGAGAGALLVVAYGTLGLPAGAAAAWALAATLTTLWWPGSVTVFDQNQHAVVLLAAVLLAWQAGRRASVAMAAIAGLAAGTLVTYQESYALLLPFIGLAVFASRSEGHAPACALPQSVDRAALVRYVVFGLACTLGVAVFLLFNYWRFGTLLAPAKYDQFVVFDSNRLAAFLSLTVSPGKSIVLFSPPAILAALGARELFRRAPLLVVTVAFVSLIHALLVIQLTFFGGDWSWGPRYLVVLIPLWALAAPWAVQKLRRSVVALILAVGLAVQVLGVSLDYQRFFFEHNLRPHFWVDQWAYFKRSQLVARPLELFLVARSGVPAEATRFAPTPQGAITYTFAGPPNYERPGRVWVRDFSVFHVLRPWPVWMYHLDAARRPFDPLPLLAVCVVTFALGLALLASGRETGSPPGARLQ